MGKLGGVQGGNQCTKGMTQEGEAGDAESTTNSLNVCDLRAQAKNLLQYDTTRVKALGGVMVKRPGGLAAASLMIEMKSEMRGERGLMTDGPWVGGGDGGPAVNAEDVDRGG